MGNGTEYYKFEPSGHMYFAAHAPITVQDAMYSLGYPEGQMHQLGDSFQRRVIFERLAQMRHEYAVAMVKEMKC